MLTRVLIVEDVAETRRWLSEIVAAALPDSVISTADTLRQARNLLHHPYDLALIDLGLPDGSGLDLLHQFRSNHTQTTCVVTTVMGDDASIVGALAAGAKGYLLKESPANILVRQLEQIKIGLPALSPRIARRIIEHFALTGPTEILEHQLTGRETQVLSLIARGMRNSEVASSLSIAPSTVASYIKSVYRKLGISSRAEAAWHAARFGLNRPDSDQG